MKPPNVRWYMTDKQNGSDKVIRSMTHFLKVPDASGILLHRPIRCEESRFCDVDKGHTIPRFLVEIGIVDATLCGGIAVEVGKNHIAVGLPSAPVVSESAISPNEMLLMP